METEAERSHVLMHAQLIREGTRTRISLFFRFCFDLTRDLSALSLVDSEKWVMNLDGVWPEFI